MFRDLSRLALGSRDLDRLAADPDLSRVRHLDLSRNALSPKLIGKLVENPHLTSVTHLVLDHNPLTPKSLRLLLDSPLCASLSRLSLAGCGLKPKTAELLGASSRLQSLHTLNLRDNPLTTVGVAHILSSPHLSALTHLNLCHTRITDTLPVPVASKLVELDLTSNRIGVDGARALSHSAAFSALARLSLPGTCLGDDGIAALCEGSALSALRHLDFGEVRFSESGMKSLVACETFELESLTFAKLDEASVHVLFAAPLLALRALKLGSSAVDARAARRLVGNAALTEGLRCLELGNAEIGEEGARALAECPKLSALRELDVWANGLGSAGVKALLSSPHLGELEALNVGANTEGADPTLFEDVRLTALRRLELRRIGGEPLSVEACRGLASAEALSSLEHLDLMDCGVGGGGLCALSESAVLKGLRELVLSGNALDDEALVLAFGEGTRLTALRTLTLYNNSIGARGLEALASAGLSQLEVLDVSNNPVKPAGARAIAASADWGNLRHLRLYQCEIGNDGSIALAESPNLNALTKLEILDNGIGEKGARAFFTSAHLPSLKVLHSDAGHTLTGKKHKALVRDRDRWVSQRGIQLHTY